MPAELKPSNLAGSNCFFLLTCMKCDAIIEEEHMFDFGEHL